MSSPLGRLDRPGEPDPPRLDAAALDALPPVGTVIHRGRGPLNPTVRKVIAVDDDPTGTQTVSGASLVTGWEPGDLDWLLAQPEPVGFVLTNSRAHPVDVARTRNEQVGAGLRAAATRRGIEIEVVSRSDSTLRGHFPDEPAALARGLGIAGAATIVMPFFGEGGRITVEGTHYVADGDFHLGVGATPFARDASFGFTSSYLPAWIEEKTGGSVAADDVTVIDLETIRTGGVAAVAHALDRVPPGSHVVVDAVEQADADVVAAAIDRSTAGGRRWTIRSAAGLVPSLAGLGPATPAAVPHVTADRGGLVVVGSHVPLSTAQLDTLVASGRVDHVAAVVDALADDATAPGEVEQLAQAAERAITAGRDLVIATTRRVRADLSGPAALARSRAVADGLCNVVRHLTTPPSFLVAKGGITAHTLAVDGLGTRRARVVGPILPGVPLWELGGEARFPGLVYVVFPGNVGTAQSLTEVVDRLRGRAP